METFLRKLIQSESTCDKGELATAQVIAEQLKLSAIQSQIDRWDSNRANLVARIKSKGQRKALLFACHIDVVPSGQGQWRYPPFSATLEDGRIYGRGAADMKGGTAAIVTAIRQIVDSEVQLAGDIILVAAAGEETDSCGIKKFINSCGEDLPELAGVIIPEPTEFQIITSHRGLLWLEIIAWGKTAHGSMPHEGINAIASIKALLDELENYQIKTPSHPLLGGCSMSINTINGGKAINVVPDQCSLGIDIRTIPAIKHSAIIADFENILSRLHAANPQFQADVSVIRDVGALETDNNSEFVKTFKQAVGIDSTIAAGFCTDGPFLNGLAEHVVIFGPGKVHLCHKPDEYIDLADVEKAVEYYKQIILNFLT